MTRREALRLTVLGGLGAATIGGAAWYWSTQSDGVSEDDLVNAIIDAAGELPLVDGAVDAFVADYRLNIGQLVDLAAWDIPLFHRFLLSTAALSPHRATDEPIAYLAFYDPFVTPCFNPIS